MTSAASDLEPRRAALVAIVLCSLAAIVVSGLLVVAHFRLESGASTGGVLCPLGGVFECDAVNASEHAAIRGVPVALLGQATYVTTAALALLAALAGGLIARGALSLLLGISIAATLFSARLLYLAMFEIGALCSLCLALDCASLAILALAVTARRAPLATQLGELARTLVRAPLRADAWCALAIACGTASLLQRQYVGIRDSAVARALAGFDATYGALPRETIAATDGRPSVGPADAQVTIVAFSDFQCPHCARLATSLREIQAKHARRARVIFRHYPICADCNPHVPRTTHRAACRLAEAAEAAHEQGRFWELHDRLFAEKPAPSHERIVALAEEAGIDVARFRSRVGAPEIRARIAQDAAEAHALGIRGTPLVFVNGRRLRSSSKETIERAVLFELFRGGSSS